MYSRERLVIFDKAFPAFPGNKYLFEQNIKHTGPFFVIAVG
jgi:hypothetical protein